MLGRRKLLATAAASIGLGATALLLGRRRLAARSTGPRAARFRYFLQIVLGGGIDPVFTLDPKTRAQVNPAVDVPFEPSAMVEIAGGHLGPLFGELAPFAPRASILRGVAVNTANHEAGFRQIFALRTGAPEAAPSFTEILGTRRDGRPLGSIAMGHVLPQTHTPGWFGDPSVGGEPGVLEHLDAADPAELAVVARVLRRQATSLRRRGATSGRARQTVANLDEIADLYDRVGSVPRFVVDPAWPSGRPRDSERLQRALWLIENDMVFAMSVAIANVQWDSHFDNARRQTATAATFIPAFVRLLRELSSRRNAHGILADQTLILVSSEIGRYPRINLADGKDHFPEIPMLVIGPAVANGAIFGETDDWMAARTVDPRSGKPSRSGIAVRLDDIGATLLELAGFDPLLHGHNGRVLRFLAS